MEPVTDESNGARHRAGPAHGAASATAVPVERLLDWIWTLLSWGWAAVRWIGPVSRWGRRVRQRLTRNPWARAWYRWLRRPSHARVDRPPPLTGHRVAERLARLLAPVVLISATAPLIAMNTAKSPVAGVGWAALAVLFCAIAPEARDWWAARRDEHEDGLAVRAHRRQAVTYGLAPMVVGLALLVLFGAPGALVALMVSMFGALHAVAALRRWWWPQRWRLRPSAHAAVASGCATAMVAVFGSALLIGYLVPAAAGWSRVALGERSNTEAVAGTVLGILITTPTFLLIA